MAVRKTVPKFKNPNYGQHRLWSDGNNRNLRNKKILGQVTRFKKWRDAEGPSDDDLLLDKQRKKQTHTFASRQILGTCPGGHSPIIAKFQTATTLWGECECTTRWWFRYPLKKPKKRTKPKSLTTEKMGGEIKLTKAVIGGPEMSLEEAQMKQRDGGTFVLFETGGKPRCPNHNEPFEVSYLELKEGKGRGQCPVSKAFFMFEVDPTMEQVDKNGNRTKAYRITGQGVDIVKN